ncbi:MAG: Bax inhibitor-1/YccA family protein [Bacteroidaceae bacterium]|nr:Bax inhibitor-1/YccA family protein [Bacteroidaceae bacterium]
MSDFNYNRDYRTVQYDGATTGVAENTLIKNVFLWMCGALVITGLTGYYVANNFSIMEMIFANRMVFYGLIIAEFALVIGLTAAINKISALTATLMFLLYSVINGAVLSSIFMIYDIHSIGTTFFVAAGTFGVMALYGATTKRDLTKMGSILVMALIGIILATLVNLFLKNGIVDTVISVLGVIIFVGLTAYDSQKIKAMLDNAEVNDTTQKFAVLGALTLYLDFVNLFLYLLRFMGQKK